MVVKGTGHDCFWSGSPMNHFQKQGKININQKKQQNPCEIAEIMKKIGFLASLILGVSLSAQRFHFPKILVLLCVMCLKEKKYDL